MKPTANDISAAVQSVILIAQAIRELGSVRSGTLYAQVMGSLSLNAYERVIGILVKQGLIREEPGNLLRWIADV